MFGNSAAALLALVLAGSSWAFASGLGPRLTPCQDGSCATPIVDWSTDFFGPDQQDTASFFDFSLDLDGEPSLVP